MSRDSLDRFGKFLIESLRDRAIAHYEGLEHEQWKSSSLISLQKELHSLSNEEKAIVKKCVISAIDVGIHDFLFRLQEFGEYDKSIQVIMDGEDIIHLSHGLNGELFGKNGWVIKFSKYESTQE